MANKPKTKNSKSETNLVGAQVQDREITQEMEESYLAYAMSVIVSRALPDVRDGLKPVHRRILYAMNEMGLRPNTKVVKSAKIVGQTMANYHPHGDTAIYDSLVRMAQNFSLRYPFVHGQGNWGSLDGDSAAAMRYCLTGDSLISTEKGLVPIEKLSTSDKLDTQDIDTKVLSYGRKINKGVKWFDSGEHPTIKITTSRGFSIQGSYNHPILVWTKAEDGAPKYSWKLLSEVRAGDITVIDRTDDLLWPEKKVALAEYFPKKLRPRMQLKKLPNYADENLAHILGALISEGSITDNKIEFCNSDREWVADFEERWHRVFPDCRLHKFERKPSCYGKKPYVRLEIHSRYVIEFLRNLGLEPVRSKLKKVPWVILQSPKKVAASFLQAYFEGDGSISSSGRMTELSCCSVSDELLKQVQTILLRFGIAGTKRFDSYRSNYKLYIRGLHDYKIFEREIGFISERKKNKLSRVVGKLFKDYSVTDFVPFLKEFAYSVLDSSYEGKRFAYRHNFDRYSNLATHSDAIINYTSEESKFLLKDIFNKLLNYHYLYDTVVGVKDGGIQKVYSIKVDSKCHSFVANGFINHNTEAKLTPIAESLLADIDKDTVDFVDNFDSTAKEPMVLPTKIPSLLINGSMGIAVGMATNIPPHNLTEVLDGLVHLIDNPDADVADLNQFVKGPDFPTAGIIYNEKDILNAYATGKGPIIMRAKADIVEGKKGFQIIVSEIPYQVNKAELISKIADLAMGKERKVDGIRDVRDESDREGVRVVVDLKQDAFPKKVLNQLFKHTELQKTFHINMLALVDGIQPQILGLKGVLEHFIEHRRVVVIRRAKFDLKKAQDRAHILEGLKKALDHIDAIIKLIRASASQEEALKNLMKKFSFSQLQATAILEMKLRALAGLERKKLEDELAEKKKLIAELEALLASPKKILALVKQEFLEIKEKYGDERRTKIVKSALKEIGEEELMPEEDSLFMITRGGYLKRMAPEILKVQKRGGKGLIGIETKEEDVVSQFFMANTHDTILFFTNSGRAFQVKGYEVPESSRTSKGKAIVNFLNISPLESVTAVVPIAKDRKGMYLFMATKNGVVKKVALSDFQKVRSNGLAAIKLKKDDELKWVWGTSGKDQIMMISSDGSSIRFKESDVRPMGRTASGVIGMRLDKEAKIIGMEVVSEDVPEKDFKLLVVMDKGYGKRTDLRYYKVQHRGGRGIMTAKLTSKTGQIISAHLVNPEAKEIIAVSQKGQVIRTELGSISVLGRATQGVRIMRMSAGDSVASVVVV